MDSAALLDLLLERLAVSDLSEGASLLVLAAWEGQRELDQALERLVTGAHPLRPTPARVGPPRTYRKS